MRYKRQICIVLILLQLIFLFGCGLNSNLDKSDYTEGDYENTIDYEPAYGGELVVPISYVKTLNPLLNSDIFLYNFNRLIFEGLFDIESDLSVKNVLAEHYSFEADGLVLNVKIRENVKWQDGVEFTAEDVKFTLDTLIYAISNNTFSGMLLDTIKTSESLKYLKDVKIIDKYNVRLTFDRIYGNVLEGLVFPIVPSHIFVKENNMKVAYERALTKENYIPIGTGPYKKNHYNELKEVVLEANKDYWGGEPYISNVIGKVLKDEDLALVSFESGQIDITTSLGLDWEKYTQNKKVGIYEFPSNRYEFLGFNFNQEIFAGEKGKALRKAIAYSVDRQSIIQKVYLGHATRNDVPIQPDSWLLSDEANSYGYNINKARQILVSAGWTDVDGDGLFEDINGKPLSIKLITNSYNELRRETANIISENLGAVGITVVKEYNENKLENVSEEMVNSQWDTVVNKITAGTYDMVLLGWEMSYIQDLSFAFHSNGSSNFLGFTNERMDELLSLAQQSVSQEEKKRIYEDIQHLIIDELPYVSLFFINSSILADKDVKGDISPNVFNMYNNIKGWYIPEALQDNKGLQ